MSRPGWNGRAIANALAHVINRDGDSCAICDHPGADSVDHEIPVTVDPSLEWEPTNWKAVHLNPASQRRGCPEPGCTCPGNVGRRTVPLTTIRAIVAAGNTEPSSSREW